MQRGKKGFQSKYEYVTIKRKEKQLPASEKTGKNKKSKGDLPEMYAGGKSNERFGVSETFSQGISDDKGGIQRDH